MLLPLKKSRNWLYVFITIFVINTAAFIINRNLLEIKLDTKTILAFAMVSFFIAVISSLGYFGIKVFSTIFILSDIIGIGYMFYIILSKINDGWADLTSIISLLVILAIGAFVGAAVQVINWLLNKNKIF